MSATSYANPAETVTTYFKLMRAGEITAALQCWSHDALWHVTGNSKYARDYSPVEYIELCKQWYVDYPEYRAELSAMTSIGELVYFTISSRHGEAPDATEGIMLYRVVDGLISEGWAIPARHGNRYTF